jgi:hypothetical protein
MNYTTDVMKLPLMHDLESDEPSESYELKSVTGGLIKQFRTARGETVLPDRGQITM